MSIQNFDQGLVRRGRWVACRPRLWAGLMQVKRQKSEMENDLSEPRVVNSATWKCRSNHASLLRSSRSESGPERYLETILVSAKMAPFRSTFNVFERLPPSQFGQQRPTADMSRLPVDSVGQVGIPYQYPCPGDFCTMPIRSGMCNAPQNQIAHPLPITAEVS